jgi:hypothetical protein
VSGLFVDFVTKSETEALGEDSSPARDASAVAEAAAGTEAAEAMFRGLEAKLAGVISDLNAGRATRNVLVSEFRKYSSYSQSPRMKSWGKDLTSRLVALDAEDAAVADKLKQFRRALRRVRYGAIEDLFDAQ